MTSIQTRFYDASAIVKLVCQEDSSQEVRADFSNSVVFTSWVLVAEAMGVLKRKWLKEIITEDQYGGLIHLLFAYIKDERISIVDLINKQDGKPNLKTYEYDVIDIRRKYPELDVADALQLNAIKEGVLGILAGESKPKLVTADKKLRSAAQAEGIEVFYVGGTS